MGLQWSMVVEGIGDRDEIVGHLQNGYEPFAVVASPFADDLQVFFKKQFFSEENEPKSSTKAENQNWAGTQTTE